MVKSADSNILFWILLLVALGVIIYLLIRQYNQPRQVEVIREVERDDVPPVIVTPPPIVPVLPPIYPTRPFRPHPFHDIPNPPYHR